MIGVPTLCPTSSVDSVLFDTLHPFVIMSRSNDKLLTFVNEYGNREMLLKKTNKMYHQVIKKVVRSMVGNV